jgi:hypothetical protein
MWNKIRLSWPLAVICLGCALVIAAANPAGAVPYSKKPIYDDTNLYPTPMSVGAHFHFSQNGNIVYQTQVYSGGVWLYSLYLYHQSTGSVTQIPSGTWVKSGLQINDQGQVVWAEHDIISSRERIYLYQDGVTIPVSGTTYLSSQPRLNNRGQVAYQAYNGDTTAIYFFDGSVFGPVAGSNSNNYNPVINDNGQIAWLGWNDGETEAHVYFFDGSASQRVSATGNAEKQQISQDGWVIWEVGAGETYIDHYALYLYKGGDPALNTVQLATNIYYLSPNPKFGASGQVVWLEKDSSGNYYLKQYLNGVTSQISGNASFDVNRRGQIAYSSEYIIYLYSNGTSTRISPSGQFSPMYINPIINNSGQIAYFRPVFSSDGDYNSHQEVYVYNCGITKLDDRHTYGYDRDLQLIDNGQVAWFERVTAYTMQPNEARIWLAKPVSTVAPILELLLLN